MDNLEDLRKLTDKLIKQENFKDILKKRDNEQFTKELLRQIEKLKKIQAVA